MAEYIEREAAYNAIKLEESGDNFDFNEGLIAAMNAIDSIPAADVRQIVGSFELVPIPPHGRLIDADALEKDIDKYIGGEESRSRFHHWVQVQSVVIPGNKGEQT